jgi:hypothetical protein
MDETSTETAPPVFEAHQCQTGCGRLADIVITTLSDSGVEIFCQPCHLAFMMAVAMNAAQQLPDDVIDPALPVS